MPEEKPERAGLAPPSLGGEDLVCVGAIAGAHGVRGLVRLKTFTGEPEAIADYGAVRDEAGQRRWTVTLKGKAKGVMVAQLSGVNDREAARALRGTRLFVPRAVLPPPENDEEFYYADLIGLTAELPDGSRFGTVRAVDDFGAGDVIEIAREGAGPVVLPFTHAVVPTVDLAGGRVVVDPPAGLLPETRSQDDADVAGQAASEDETGEACR